MPAALREPTGPGSWLRWATTWPPTRMSSGLLDQLRSAPAGQRHQVAEDYLKAHPQTTGELRDAMKQMRQHARSCRAGGN